MSDPLAQTDVTAQFTDLLGIELGEMTPTRVVATMAVGDQHKQPYGIVHGGVYCSLAETVASIGGVVALHAKGAPEGSGAVGQSNQTDFLRATREGTLTATATPIHVGRSVQLWAVDITDQTGALCAQSRVRLFNVDATSMSR
jgi:1,4-dihydroxy-2-naphthoyl-CoA hydrolase